MKGRYFGNIPVEADLKLILVETCILQRRSNDSGNKRSKLALDRDISGPLKSISAYCFKHTPIQMRFSINSNFIEFVEGKMERNYNFY